MIYKVTRVTEKGTGETQEVECDYMRVEGVAAIFYGKIEGRKEIVAAYPINNYVIKIEK